MSKRKSRRPLAAPSSAYQRAIRQADEVLSRNGVDVRPDNWQQLALEWFAPHEPDRSELARSIAAHHDRLGPRWGKDVLRLEVFFQNNDYKAVIAHYDHAFSPYPRCALIEMWVADRVYRQGGDLWRARQMYRHALDELPNQAKPRYEMGFISYLLGDFPGALEWFNQAAALVADDDIQLGSRIFYNRGLMRYLLEGDKWAAIADMEEALRLRPDYPQALEALRGLRGTPRWVPW